MSPASGTHANTCTCWTQSQNVLKLCLRVLKRVSYKRIYIRPIKWISATKTRVSSAANGGWWWSTCWSGWRVYCGGETRVYLLPLESNWSCDHFYYFFSTKSHSGCAQDLRSKPCYEPPEVQNRTSDPTWQSLAVMENLQRLLKAVREEVEFVF